MKILLRKILKKIFNRLKKSSFFQSIIQEPQKFRPRTVFGQFEDSTGKSHKLFRELRSELKPGWDWMLKPENDYYIPAEREIHEKILFCSAENTELYHYMKLFNIPLKKSKILEIGCYDGAQVFTLARDTESNVTGSDYSGYYINQRTAENTVDTKTVNKQYDHLQKIRREFQKTVFKSGSAGSYNFIEDDICNTQIPDNSYNIICSFEVLEHVQNPQKFFNNTYKILKPGGIAYHKYNPFFSLLGGHSLCTLDFLWGHARLSHEDFKRYLKEIRPDEYHQALRFYENNLNRMKLSDLEESALNAGFEIGTLIPWYDSHSAEQMTADIFNDAVRCFPGLKLNDLICPFVTIILKKPE